jgi:hypothetical protein
MPSHRTCRKSSGWQVMQPNEIKNSCGAIAEERPVKLGREVVSVTDLALGFGHGEMGFNKTEALVLW